MNRNYQAIKTTRQSNHNIRYQPCTSQRQIYTQLNTHQSQSESVARLQLKKSISSTNINNHFTQSLINKMRRVPRPLSNQNRLLQVHEKLFNANLKLQKSKQKLQTYKQSFVPIHIKIYEQQINKESSKPSSEIQRLKKQLSELIKMNKELQQAIKGLQCQLFYEKQKLQLLTTELESKEQLIQQLENQLNSHFYSSNIDHQITVNIKNTRKKQSFQINKTVNEFILGIPSFQKISLLKANAEIMNIKRQLTTLQKAHQSKYAQLNRIKNDQIDHLRKIFSANLKHYKKMIIKCTSKKGDQSNPKQSEQIMQSTLLQSSCIIQ